MNDLKTAAQQALEALALAQLNGESGLRDYEVLEIAEAAVALRAALAEPVQEPVQEYASIPGTNVRVPVLSKENT